MKAEQQTFVQAFLVKEKANNLPAQILVIHMTDVQRFGCERIRLHLNIGSGEFVDQGRLANVRKTA